MRILFDDARDGGAQPRLYQHPSQVAVAWTVDEVAPALASIRAGLAAGAHAAGYLAYEAGHAFDPQLASSGRAVEGPLLAFGLFPGYSVPDLDRLLPSPEGSFVGRPRPRIAQADYEAAVDMVREQLFAGDYYQVNLTFGCDVAVAGDALAIYARLRRSSRAGWGGVLVADNRTIISLSPEQFFTVRDGTIEARPMKGTAPRRADPAADADEARGLAADEKQRAENLMIVDLMRNDLARVAKPGSVEVPERFEVETYPTLHQLTSRVTARLRDGVNAVDVLATIFPCGSVTGAPKVAAIEALGRLEPEPSARLGLGSGLVVDSNPRDEWAECLLKGDFVRAENQDFDLIETMRFDPSAGIAELARHLDRMRASADQLDFRFDRHAARNELQAATFGRQGRAMVRLLLSRTGAMAIQVKPFEDPPETPVRVALRPLPIEPSDFRLRHKTSDRRFFDRARQEGGAYETIFVGPDGQLTEGSRTNIFVERDGKLLTPSSERGLMPGILRASLIDEGRAVEAALTADDLGDGFFVGNIVRGLIPARLA